VKLSSNQKFVIDLEMLHLAMELAAADAAKIELERQFRKQHPNLQLAMKSHSVDFGSIQNLEISIPNFDVEYRTWSTSD
jgi:hypothetical protein